jgi:uncharacterized protein (DUF1697 family)
MPHHIALLRGINVGGHTVKMQLLRERFESLGFSNVETVIASGNVVFESPEKSGPGLEKQIERCLEDALGYQVATFLRTVPELSAVVQQQPFSLVEPGPETVVYAIFLRNKPAPQVVQALEALKTGNDEARAGKREIYWLRRERGKDSEVFGARLGKILGAETTSRNMKTIIKIVAKYRQV